MSSADRDARIAAAEASLNRADPSYAANFVPWLIAELRAALSREAATKKDADAWKELAQTNARNVMHLRERWDEAQKDVERLDWLDAQGEEVDVDLAKDATTAYSFGISIGWRQRGARAKSLRDVIDCGRASEEQR